MKFEYISRLRVMDILGFLAGILLVLILSIIFYAGKTSAGNTISRDFTRNSACDSWCQERSMAPGDWGP